MEHISPLGAVYQAGTLSGNPVAMAAGAATLVMLRNGKVYGELEQLGRRLEEIVAPVARATGASFVRQGSIFWLAMQPEAPRCVEDVKSDGMARYADLHAAMLEAGIYLAPSGWEVGFLNAAMTRQDIIHLGDALSQGLRATIR